MAKLTRWANAYCKILQRKLNYFWSLDFYLFFALFYWILSHDSSTSCSHLVPQSPVISCRHMLSPRTTSFPVHLHTRRGKVKLERWCTIQCNISLLMSTLTSIERYWYYRLAILTLDCCYINLFVICNGV